MSFEARAFLILFASVHVLSCLTEREGPKPPSFPGGGLLTVAAPLPVFLSDGTTPVLSAIEGVYDTSSRFGASVVVHSSTWGDPAASIRASLAILAHDHYAFALLQGGCLDADGTGPGRDNAVFEGYWRYLDDPNPSPATTGLVRLFVQPTEIAQQLCAGDTAIAPGSASLEGASGNGENAPDLPLHVSYVRARKSKSGPEGQRFGVGMHHGGCVSTDNCGISENTPETLVFAKQLGADYLEIDLHLTADKIPVSFHLTLSPAVVQGVYCTGKIEDFTYDELLANCRLRNGEVIPRFEDMLAYGLRRTNLPFYLDMKSPDAIVPTSQVIARVAQRLVTCSGSPPELPADAPNGAQCLFPGSASVMARAIIGLPAADFVDAYRSAQAQGQLAPGQRCIVEENPNDVLDIPCVAWMPRYTRGPMTSEVQRLQSMGKFVGYWTINDPKAIDEFLKRGVPNGILTDYLGFVNQRWEAIGILPNYPVAP